MRRIVSVGAAALVAALSLHASADSGMPLYPTVGCQDLSDPAEDAFLIGAPGEPSAPSFDVTGLSFRTTPYAYNVVLRVPKLDALGGSRGTGDTWRVSFVSGKHLVQLKVSRFTPVPAMVVVVPGLKVTPSDAKPFLPPPTTASVPTVAASTPPVSVPVGGMGPVPSQTVSVPSQSVSVPGRDVTADAGSQVPAGSVSVPSREVGIDVNGAYERRTPGTSLNEVIVDDAAVVGVHPAGDFDVVRGYLTISIDRDTLDAILGAPVTTVTGVDVLSATRVVVGGTPQLVGEFSLLTVDGATAPAKQEFDVTGNACFV